MTARRIARASLLVLAALCACHAKRARPAGAPPASLQIVAIDDSIDPFATASAPSDVTIQSELGPLGGGKEIAEHYARTIVRPGETEAAARARLRRWLATVSLPSPARFGVGIVHDEPGSAYARSWVLAGPTVITTSDVVDAEPTNTGGDVGVTVTLSRDGANRFEDFTRAWVGRRAAICLDDDVTTAPVIRTPIGGGRLEITTGRDTRSAEKLAASLRPAR